MAAIEDAFSAATFGELNAEDYDLLHDPGTTEATVAVISELAGQGRRAGPRPRR
jgi:hypothetical protein